jgi:hypothetical protein
VIALPQQLECEKLYKPFGLLDHRSEAASTDDVAKSRTLEVRLDGSVA